MEKWRLLKTGYANAYRNMAIDEAILYAHSKELAPPTVRFYQWNPSAISIGYFQSLEREVDIDECHRRGIDYVRRITGGGAVYHDKELTYSIVISENHPEIPSNILESYHRICGAIIKGLYNIGINSRYSPINDILVDGRKISGNAQTRKYKTVLQHGTILIDVDVDTMFTLLKVPDEKIKDKFIANVKDRVTSIRKIRGEEISFDKLADALKKGFEEEFNIKLVEGKLTEEEEEFAEEFEKNRFSKKEWNYRR
ncbi:MAG: lipoate--protein ligase family protein [Thermoplasmata archaeon]|nr:MAG: lipoate--protein ligase family protein [Thermoplasmata archaeon]